MPQSKYRGKERWVRGTHLPFPRYYTLAHSPWVPHSVWNVKTKSYKELTISFWVNVVMRKNMIEIGNTLKSIRSSSSKICTVKSKPWIVSLSSYIESIVVGERIICFTSRSREIEITLIVTKRKPNVKTTHLPTMHVICITLAKKMYSVK